MTDTLTPLHALVRQQAERLEAAGVALGHGTATPFDEAAWLVLWQLGLPLDTDLDDPVVRMITRGGTGYFASLPTPRPLSDDQLRGLTMPVHVAIADGSPVTSGQRSIERAALIPDIESRIWPNTTHSLPMQVAEPLAAELADFWARHDT